MNACPKCGRAVPVADRFCGGCGADLTVKPGAGLITGGAGPVSSAPPDDGRIAAVAPSLDLGDPGNDVLLEGITSTQAIHSESEATSSAKLRWVVLGVVAVGLLVFGLSVWPAGEASPLADAAQADTDADDNADTGTRAEDEDQDGSGEESGSNLTVPSWDEEEEEGADAEEVGTDDDAEVGTDRDIDADTGDEIDPDGTASSAPGQPMLGEKRGLGLLGNFTRTNQLRLLDLDTGILHELAARGEPIGVLDGVPVIRDEDRVGLLRLDTSESEVQLLPTNQNGWTDVVSIGSDRVWLLESDPGQQGEDGWLIGAYDSAGDRIDETMLVQWFGLTGWDPEGRLTQTVGGGVYRQAGDRFERVSTGVLVTAGERLALVRECDDQMVCRLHWYDRETWELQPLPEPEGGVTSQGRVILQSDDRWLHSFSWIDGQVRLHDVATGRLVRRVSDFGTNTEQVQAPISPDGDLWAEVTIEGARIVDLETDEEWDLDPIVIWGPSSIAGVFVELEDVGFLSD